MGRSALVDTNILIDFLDGVAFARSELALYTDRALSVISRIELFAGVRLEDRERAERFLDLFVQIGLTDQIAEEAVKLRRSSRLKLPDAVILATARVENRILLTRNTRDFSPGRFVRIPYQL